MSPMLVTSDETGLESVGGEIVSGRADGSKGVRRRSTEDDCLAHGDWLPGEQHSNQLNPNPSRVERLFIDGEHIGHLGLLAACQPRGIQIINGQEVEWVY